MQVTCPSCGARYAVDPLAIGPVGRIVQCARCAHRWLQTVAVATLAAVASAPAPRPQPPVEPVPDIVIRPQRQRASLPALIEPRPPRLWTTANLMVAGLIAAVVLVAVGVYFFHGEIVARMPAEWRSMLGQRT
jgi:predicted Zn finger-like uncharacterized protein